MKNLSLRIRIFLFFFLAAAGSLIVIIGALWVGFAQLGSPDAMSAFVTTGLIAGFGVCGLVIGIWLLFDENVSKPVEEIAASLRVRGQVNLKTPIDVTRAKYLGDLAPAASALGAILDDITRSRDTQTNDLLREMTTQRNQLVEILSDIPIATILVSSTHQIVLYDGQAATLLESVGHARLNTCVFDYFEDSEILKALAQLDGVETSKLRFTVTALTGKEYSGHIRQFGAGGGYTLMLEVTQLTSSRPLTYDFGLLATTSSATILDTPLRELNYVVFDCETTGLNPTIDEVVQLAGVRVVNGTPVLGEVFETYVNPGIAIPKRSTTVHGVDDSAVTDAPSFDKVCHAFHGFAKDAVLVAHHAAFDMAFLHKQSAKSGPAFDHPVLDTVLLSAVIFGGSATHTLDALCDRLGVEIPALRRHTAMGDALATAKALGAMIGILDARGFTTIGDVQAEADKHRRIIKS
ncbi:MAG: exonuclease domain-containing protein [Sulfitobacter sp.]